MIFQYTLAGVLSGTKTATSRVIKVCETAVYGVDEHIEAVRQNGRDKYRVGKTYAVQPGRTQPAVARIKLLGIKRQRVAETSVAEAKQEGFESREAFFAQWHEIHGEDKLNAEVWLLTFELVPVE